MIKQNFQSFSINSEIKEPKEKVQEKIEESKEPQFFVSEAPPN